MSNMRPQVLIPIALASGALTHSSVVPAADYSAALTMGFVIDEAKPPNLGSCYRETAGGGVQTGYKFEPCNLPFDPDETTTSGTRSFFTVYEGTSSAQIARISPPEQDPRTVIWERIEVKTVRTGKVSSATAMWSACSTIANPSKVVVVTRSYAGASKRTRLKARQQTSATISNILFEAEPKLSSSAVEHGKGGNTVLLEVTDLSTLCSNAARDAIAELQATIDAMTKKAKGQDEEIVKKEGEIKKTQARLDDARTNAELTIKSLGDQHRATIETLTKLYKEQNDKLVEHVQLLSKKVGSLETALTAAKAASEAEKTKDEKFPDPAPPAKPTP